MLLHSPLQILLLTILRLFFASTQGVQSCNDTQLCANGGKCSLASPTFLAAHCKEDEYFFNRSCYFAYESPLSWNEAERTCALRGSHLVTLSSQDVQEWMSNLITKKTASSSGALRDIGFWTAGHSVLNGTKPVYVWMPNYQLIENFRWYYGQPNLYENNSDICIVLRAESEYRAWHSQPCSDLNFFVCSRESEGESSWSAQCECQKGYKGRYCEVSGPSKEVQLISQVTLCAQEAFEFSCISGGVINVDYAFYGTDESSRPPCQTTDSKVVDRCSDPFALITLIQRCQGLRYCQAKTVQSLFPHSICTKGALSYRLRCTEEPLAKCPKGTTYIQGRCYSTVFYSNLGERLPWLKARKQCLAKGGDLAGPINRNVHNMLRIDMTRKNTAPTGYWIGFQTEALDDSVWLNGQNVGDFVPPDSAFGKQVGCGYYNSSSQSHVWSTDHCDSRKNWVCEFSPLDNSPRPREELPKDFGKSRVFKGSSRIMSTLLFLRLALNTFQFSDPIVSDAMRPIGDPQDLFGEGPFCPEITWNGLQFPRTRACAEAVVRCPDEDTVEGVVVFKCHCETATWPEKADTNNCTHKWVGEIGEAIERNDPVVPIARNLAEQLEPSSSRVLYGADVVGSVDIQDRLLDIARQQIYSTEDEHEARQQANNFTKFIGLSGDHLLSSTLRGVWDDLDKKVRISKASLLMRTLEESAILLAGFIDGTEKKLDYKNWAMEVELHRQDEIDVISDDMGRGAPMAFAPLAGNIPVDTPMDAPQETSPMTFANYSKSPVIRLPSFNILRSSATRPMPKTYMNEAFLFAAAPARTASVDRSPLRLGYYLFTSIGSLLTADNRTIVNSHVIGASVNDPTQSVSLPNSSPATFTFYHIRKEGVANPRCVFWDTKTMLWSENGCTLVQTNENFTDCSCNHLTSFAILMDITGSLETVLTGSAAVALDFITIIGCALSSICLALSVLVFTCFRSLWNVRNTIHRNLCLSLLVAELLFVIGINRAENEAVCRGIAVALHYFFLSAFTWMLLEGYQLYLMLIQVFEPDRTRIIVYYVFGYGLAAIVVAISAGISWQHYGTANYCWIDVSTPTIWAFVVPITIVIVINVVFLFIALKVVLSVRSRDRTTSQRVAGWLKGSATLLCLLGITWIFGYLTAVTTAEPVFAYIFTILNSLQGLLIFVLHVVLNEKVRVTLVRFLRKNFCCVQDPTSSYNSKSYLSSKQRLMNLLRPKDKDSHQSTASSTDSQKLSATNERTTLEPQKYRTSTTQAVHLEVTLKRGKTESSVSSPERDAGISSRGKSQSAAERQRTAPVRRKKFPLGATDDDRIVDNKETVFIERF
ncbi:hypothetical protein QR680_001472 [Steinernema hermaphroditum]|uniref:Latrophilin-3 n=1 Tax=Steinernema hermaphroditum TaxID=289476 RepID=A0AA39LFK3_9BILA|nr:hypothetical protein QR680_001472 [Steinernema hermaphroditum]